MRGIEEKKAIEAVLLARCLQYPLGIEITKDAAVGYLDAVFWLGLDHFNAHKVETPWASDLSNRRLIRRNLALLHGAPLVALQAGALQRLSVNRLGLGPLSVMKQRALLLGKSPLNKSEVAAK